MRVCGDDFSHAQRRGRGRRLTPVKWAAREGSSVPAVQTTLLERSMGHPCV
jgi:hypothetical protein